jgi:hypothetical protein
VTEERRDNLSCRLLLPEFHYAMKDQHISSFNSKSNNLTDLERSGGVDKEGNVATKHWEHGVAWQGKREEE